MKCILQLFTRNTKTVVIPFLREHSYYEPDERISIFRMKLDTQHIMTSVEDEKNLVYKGLDYNSVKIPEMVGPNITSQAEMFEECLQKIEKNERIKKKIVYYANIIGNTFSEASDKVQPVILFPHEIDGKIIGYTTGYNPNLCNVIVKHNKITKIIGSSSVDFTDRRSVTSTDDRGLYVTKSAVKPTEPEIESESSYGYFYSDSDEDQW